jgi:hypothetical protein
MNEVIDPSNGNVLLSESNVVDVPMLVEFTVFPAGQLKLNDPLGATRALAGLVIAMPPSTAPNPIAPMSVEAIVLIGCPAAKTRTKPTFAGFPVVLWDFPSS